MKNSKRPGESQEMMPEVIRYLSQVIYYEI